MYQSGHVWAIIDRPSQPVGEPRRLVAGIRQDCRTIGAFAGHRRGTGLNIESVTLGAMVTQRTTRSRYNLDCMAQVGEGKAALQNPSFNRLLSWN